MFRGGGFLAAGSIGAVRPFGASDADVSKLVAFLPVLLVAPAEWGGGMDKHVDRRNPAGMRSSGCGAT